MQKADLYWPQNYTTLPQFSHVPLFWFPQAREAAFTGFAAWQQQIEIDRLPLFQARLACCRVRILQYLSLFSGQLCGDLFVRATFACVEPTL